MVSLKVWAGPLHIMVVTLLFAPALLSFGTHIVEHAWPLGFSRMPADQIPRLPMWWLESLAWFAYHCVVPTWCGIGVAIWTSAVRPFRWPSRLGLAVVSGLAYVSMRGMDAVAHSCWGEAPHASWF